ncbi:translation initiation factor IF-2 [Sneathiella chinensis]|uniref:Translation initiation factor IF-2 n=1 Tax=Sneathiella chinensis TaxID=349750 RepID=A0ABQ5U196_9PROT|nr:translation initiation factor IF-2 [Sneathiella chinensis]GLQ05196.1 translation initiation factor IF-2 [Sneathiella chinensis]
MTETNDKGGRKSLSLNKPLEVKKSTGDAGQVRQSFSHGRSKTVQVEVRKKRGAHTPTAAKPTLSAPAASGPKKTLSVGKSGAKKPAGQSGRGKDNRDEAALTSNEKAARLAALAGAREQAQRQQEIDREREAREAEEAARKAAEKAEADKQKKETERLAKRKSPEERRRAEEEEARRLMEAAEATKVAEAAVHREKKKAAAIEEPKRAAKPAAPSRPSARPAAGGADVDAGPADRTAGAARKKGKTPTRTTDDRGNPSAKRMGDQRRRSGRLTIGEALDDRGPKQRSLASVKRARKKQQMMQTAEAPQKVYREVIIPEVISVQELANRMSERSVDVIKCLMKLGIMATANQTIDADTAELVVEELGHTAKRVAESDVEIGLGMDDQDAEETLLPRAPVVAVMGHVDHGKTSLLDALRKTDVVSGEAGGITQHIGAYQVKLASGNVITFLDTPGHEAFTAMRMRGASVTDIVILVVAADDSVMPQTIEAIKHAKAAGVPIIIAINKCDKPAANPDKVRQELLQHEVFVEDMGGDVLSVEVSALNGTGLDKLQDAILLQSEMLELRANPERAAQGTVVESKIETGRGMVATVLVKRGTLRIGDNFVAGSAYGKVRALLDHRGNQVEEAGPSVPVEILGIQGAPVAGDDFAVTENEGKAKEIAEYRLRLEKEKKVTATARGTIEQMFSAIKEGTADELPVVIKADVQGSSEAIVNSLEKLSTDEVAVKVLLSGVGGITESDITLAAASNAMIIAFNTRANKQAREEAQAAGVDIRYYSVIYNVIDDIRAMLSGMLAPTLQEDFLGYAEIREVFNITKVGKIGGCMVTEGLVKRGAKVRLLRDNVVIHEGTLSTLKRFKDEVKEVKSGMECGMAFENYHDIQVGDFIECFEIKEIAREL